MKLGSICNSKKEIIYYMSNLELLVENNHKKPGSNKLFALLVSTAPKYFLKYGHPTIYINHFILLTKMWNQW